MNKKNAINSESNYQEKLDHLMQKYLAVKGKSDDETNL